MSGPLTLDLADEVTAGLARLASRHGSSASDLAAEAVRQFVADEMAEVDGIEQALEDMRQGRIVPHGDVMADVERVLTGGQAAVR